MSRVRTLLYWVLGIEGVLVGALSAASLTQKEAALICLLILLAATGAMLGTLAKWLVDDWRWERRR